MMLGYGLLMLGLIFSAILKQLWNGFAFNPRINWESSPDLPHQHDNA